MPSRKRKARTWVRWAIVRDSTGTLCFLFGADATRERALVYCSRRRRCSIARVTVTEVPRKAR